MSPAQRTEIAGFFVALPVLVLQWKKEGFQPIII